MFFKNPECFDCPNFKRKEDDRDSFTACNHEFTSGPTIYITKDGLRMTKAGIIKATFPRCPRNGWKLKQVTVDRTMSGKYYAYILYECVVKEPEAITPTPETTIGLQYSVRHFYAADNGELADPPQWLRESQVKLANIQQRLCYMKPGSKNYQEMVQRYHLLHERVASQRRDFIHKESRRIANAWDAVCVRGDDMAELSQKLNCGNAMKEGCGAFREHLRYKLERQSKALIVADR